MTSIEVRVESNAREAGAWIHRIRRQALPYATAVSLTKCARPVGAELGASIATYFKQRSKGLARAFTEKRAEKSDWPRPQAIVHLREWAEFMADHATGAERRPEKGARRMAVPTSLVKRTTTGRVRATQKPRRLRDKKGTVIREVGASTVIQIARGRRAKTKAGIFYTLHRRVKIKEVWPVERIAQEKFASIYPRIFRRELHQEVQKRRGR
jgi:hypothetical protein